MANITLATAPKPFTNPHIATIQKNAIQSWLQLGSEVEVLVIGDEVGAREAADELGVQFIDSVARNESGTPLVSSLFECMRRCSSSPILVYVNADIILMPDFLAAVKSSQEQKKAFLGIGQRWDMDITDRYDFGKGWDQQLAKSVKETGKLHAPVGSDYFVFPRDLFQVVPGFAIGRAGWDNWMIFEARQRGWCVIDMTNSAVVIHQNHDYSHLPGGQPHYRLPETAENTRMAGGRRMIFKIQDAEYFLIAGRLEKIPRYGAKLKREIEIFPLVKLHSPLLGEIFFALFHPRKAWGEWRGRLIYKIKKIRMR